MRGSLRKSNDVIGLQDLYLQLDVSKSTVDMVTDTVGAGEGSSGSNYTATSSYIRGDIARLTVTVDLPTPPLPEPITIIFLIIKVIII